MPKFNWDNQIPVESSPVKKGKFSWDEQETIEPKRDKIPSEAEAGIRGAVSGFAADLEDETGAIGSTALNAITGFSGPLAGGTFEDLVKQYRSKRDESRAEKKKLMEENPKAFIAGNIAGSVISPVNKIAAPVKAIGPMTRLGTVAQAAKTSALQGAVFGAGMSDSDLTKGEIGKFTKDTAASAAIGGAVPFAIEGVKLGAQKIASGTSDLAKSFFASRTGTSVENNMNYWKNADEINAAPELAMIKDGVDDAVGAIRKEVDAGKLSIEKAKEAISDLKTNLRNSLTDAKMDAREAVRKTDELFKEASNIAIQPLKDKKAPTQLAGDIVSAVEDLKQNVIKKSGDAYKTLDTSFPGIVPLKGFFEKGNKLIDEIRQEKTPEAMAIANKLSEYLDNVRGTSGKELENEIASVPIAKIKASDIIGKENSDKKSLLTFIRSKGGINKVGQSNDILDSEANQLFRKNGMNSDAAVQAAQESGYLLENEGIDELLEKVRKEVSGKKQYPVGNLDESLINKYVKQMNSGEITPKELVATYDIDARGAKKLIQGLDNVSEYDDNASALDKGLSRNYKSLRNELDNELKNAVPEYREAMRPVAKDAGILSEAYPFGDERSAIGKLSQIASPKGKLDRELLAQIEESTGRNGEFTRKIDEFTRAQEILKDPKKIEAIKRSLPEYQDYRQAMAKLAKMKPNWSRDQLERALTNSKEAKALFMAEEALKKAEQKFAPIAKITKDSSQAKLESFTKPKGASIETRRAIEELEKLSGKKFIKDLDNRGILDSYSKSAMNGSRNTVYGSVTGAAIGAAFGGLTGAAALSSAGAAYGQLVDRFGPKMAKTVMDGLLSMKKNPSIPRIRALPIPSGIKDELEREFKVYLQVTNANKNKSMGMVAENEKPKSREPSELKGEALWISNGLDKLGISEESAANIQNSKAGKRLLIEASDLPMGSKKLELIKKQIKELEQ